MNIELFRPEPEHVPDLARICYEAFKVIHDRHGFPPDMPAPEVANQIVGLFVSRPDFYAVAARADGRLVGSNFLSLSDPIASVGPITVDPAFEGHGAGRALMRAVLDHASDRGLPQIRLLQDSFNTRSLSLYASFGFDLREPVGLLDLKPAATPDATVRPATEADLPTLDELTRRIYKCSRRGELTAALSHGWPPFVRESNGRKTGYFLPGFMGHGVAESEVDALALIGEAARHAPPGFALCFCPLRQGNFYRAALHAGHRLRKVMNLMTLGPYEPPEGIWMPSIGY